MYKYKPAKVGIGIGALGVLLAFLTTALLVLIPQELMTPAASSAYTEAWSRPVMTVGNVSITYGIPLAGVVSAYCLTTKNYSRRSVMTGFVIGGLVLGIGDALLGVTVTHLFVENPAIGQSLVSHVFDTVTLGGRLVGGALIGTFSASFIGKRGSVEILRK